MYSVPIMSFRHKKFSPDWKWHPVAWHSDRDLWILSNWFIICYEGSSNKQTYCMILHPATHFLLWNIQCLKKNRYTFWLIMGVQVGYLTTLSVPRLYRVDDRLINECEAFFGMRIGRGNRSTLNKPAQVPLCPPHFPHCRTWHWPRKDSY
jgi:hypothetical protein